MTKFPFRIATVMIASAGLAFAQEAPEAPAEPTAAARAPQPAQVRAWIFPGASKAAAKVVFRSSAEQAPSEMAASTGGARFTSPVYREWPAGEAFCEITAAGQSVFSGNLPLREGGHYTMLVWNNGTKWEFKTFADAAPSKNASDRPLRILNFADGRTTAVAPDGAPEAKVAGNAVQEVRLPAKINGLTVRVLDPEGGPPAQTSTEVDFAEQALAYLVVGPDYRGRMRPQLIEGGPPKIDPASLVLEAPTDPAQRAALEAQRIAQARQLERNHLAAQMAILEAQIKEGVNVPQNADGLMRDLQDRVKKLRAEPAGGGASATPSQPLPTPTPSAPGPPPAS